MYQIFDAAGHHIGSSDHEPNQDDLSERGEFAVIYDSSDAVLQADPDTRVITALPSAPDVWHEWRDGGWVLTASAAARRLADVRAAKQTEAANMAQAFINQAAGLADVPDFEVQTWSSQAAEAAAWLADRSSPTPMLDTIAAARNIDRVALSQKAAAKSAAFSLLTAHIAGQRQAFKDAIKAAADTEALAAINIVYTAPVIEPPRQDSGNVVTGAGSAALGD